MSVPPGLDVSLLCASALSPGSSLRSYLTHVVPSVWNTYPSMGLPPGEFHPPFIQDPALMTFLRSEWHLWVFPCPLDGFLSSRSPQPEAHLPP